MNFSDPTVYQNKHLLIMNSLEVSKKEKTDMHASILILSSGLDIFLHFWLDKALIRYLMLKAPYGEIVLISVCVHAHIFINYAIKTGENNPLMCDSGVCQHSHYTY